MLKKRRSRTEDVVRVTFSLPGETEASTIVVLGDFNAWQPGQALARRKDGTWRATLTLQPGRSYEFRYLADGERWLNDPRPDALVPNLFGSENSVVHT